MASITALDFRVTNHAYTMEVLQIKAAKQAVKFIRKQAAVARPEDKAELAKVVWGLYWSMHEAGLLEGTTRRVRRLLRKKYGFWSATQAA